MGSLRIIAGEFKGRRIRLVRGVTTRPTAERAREALFSILGARLDGARVLDAYSGTGALGLEALSRGAQQVVFIEADRRLVDGLRETLEGLCAARRGIVVLGHAVDRLGSGAVGGPFDLILADPPYTSDERGRFLQRVVEGDLLSPKGTVVVERDHRAAVAKPPTAGLQLVRSERYGRCSFDFYGSRA